MSYMTYVSCQTLTLAISRYSLHSRQIFSMSSLFYCSHMLLISTPWTCLSLSQLVWLRSSRSMQWPQTSNVAPVWLVFHLSSSGRATTISASVPRLLALTFPDQFALIRYICAPYLSTIYLDPSQPLMTCTVQLPWRWISALVKGQVSALYRSRISIGNPIFLSPQMLFSLLNAEFAVAILARISFRQFPLFVKMLPR